MAYKKRKLEDLNVLDDFMFSAAASDEEVGKEFCRTVLSVLLQKELGEIQITAQKTILPCTPEMRGIRMDVEVKEPLEDTLPSLNVYDVEPHLRKEKYFPRQPFLSGKDRQPLHKKRRQGFWKPSESFCTDDHGI